MLMQNQQAHFLNIFYHLVDVEKGLAFINSYYFWLKIWGYLQMKRDMGEF